MKTAVYPYKPYSSSAKALAEAMEIRRIKHENSRFKPAGKAVINWGASSFPHYLLDARLLINHPDIVQRAGNKASFLSDAENFNFLSRNRINIPHFTFNIESAKNMLDDGPVMVRKNLTGHSGDGIIYCTQPDQLVAAPLYVQYIKKYSEFRVHCIRHPDGEECAFFVQRKARKKDVPDDQVNWKVRNVDGGFIYANDPANVGEYPEGLLKQAGLAMGCSGLTFGAVDIIYNKAQKKCYVLEINTAPGLSGRTIQFYADNLKALTDAA